MQRRISVSRARRIGLKRTAHVFGIIVTLILASCDSDSALSTTAERSTKEEPVSATEASDPLEGAWHTEITCREMVAALEQGGVSKFAPGIVQDEFGLDQRPNQSDPCAGVDATADHTLRFQGGHFALFAGDELGLEASYELIDEDTFVTDLPTCSRSTSASRATPSPYGS